MSRVKRTPTLPRSIEARCTQIADAVVPAYRTAGRALSCTGTIAKRWQAAWDGACLALAHDPQDYRLKGRPS